MTQASSHVKRDGDRLIKTFADELVFRIELAKSERAHELGAASGLFRAPKILDCDRERRSIVFELVKGLTPLRKVDFRRELPPRFGDRAGKALYLVHEKLQLPAEFRFDIAPEFAAEGRQVFIHGDLSGENVCIGSDGQPVIIDWSASPIYGNYCTCGTPLYDIAWFVGGVHRNSFRGWRFRREIAAMLVEFLESYFGCSTELDGLRDKFPGYLRSFYQVRKRDFFRGKAKIRSKLFHVPSFLNWHSFIKGLHP